MFTLKTYFLTLENLAQHFSYSSNIPSSLFDSLINFMSILFHLSVGMYFRCVARWCLLYKAKKYVYLKNHLEYNRI